MLGVVIKVDKEKVMTHIEEDYMTFTEASMVCFEMQRIIAKLSGMKWDSGLDAVEDFGDGLA